MSKDDSPLKDATAGELLKRIDFDGAEELYKGETRWNIIKVGIYLLFILWMAWAAGWHTGECR